MIDKICALFLGLISCSELVAKKIVIYLVFFLSLNAATDGVPFFRPVPVLIQERTKHLKEYVADAGHYFLTNVNPDLVRDCKNEFKSEKCKIFHELLDDFLKRARKKHEESDGTLRFSCCPESKRYFCDELFILLTGMTAQNSPVKLNAEAKEFYEIALNRKIKDIKKWAAEQKFSENNIYYPHGYIADLESRKSKNEISYEEIRELFQCNERIYKPTSCETTFDQEFIVKHDLQRWKYGSPAYKITIEDKNGKIAAYFDYDNGYIIEMKVFPEYRNNCKIWDYLLKAQTMIVNEPDVFTKSSNN